MIYNDLTFNFSVTSDFTNGSISAGLVNHRLVCRNRHSTLADTTTWGRTVYTEGTIFREIFNRGLPARSGQHEIEKKHYL